MTNPEYSYFRYGRHWAVRPAGAMRRTPQIPEPPPSRLSDDTAFVNLAQINADLTAGHDALHEAFELHRKFRDLGV